MSAKHDAPAQARREPTISDADRAAIAEAARRELRIEFAKAALTGMLANDAIYQRFRNVHPLAATAWTYADAMLATEGGDA